MKKIIFLVLILSTMFAYSKDDGRRIYNSYGFFTGLNYNMYSSDFSTLPGIPCCSPLFDEATGVGLSIGLLADFQTNNILEYSGFDFRLSFDMLDAEYNILEPKAGNAIKDDLIDINNPSQTPVDDVAINHNLLIGLSIISLEPTFRYSPIYDLNLHLGFKFGIPVSSSFNQSSTIQSPDYVMFKEGGFKRNVANGPEIPEINGFQSSLVLGAGYEFPLSKKLFIVPEIRYFLALNNVNIDTWKANHMRFGVAFKYYPIKEVEKPIIMDTIITRDTTIVYDAELDSPITNFVDMTINESRDETEERIFITKNINEKYETFLPEKITIAAVIKGQIEEVEQIIIEEFEMEEGFPLLPYVFFQEGKGQLRDTRQQLRSALETDDKVWNYDDLISNFNEDSLSWNTLVIHSNLLNIIGSRMTKYPNSKITITGTNNNNGVEQNNIILSEERANSVRNYLINEWSLSPDRISTNSRNLPSVPGNPETKDGSEENQRAEITSDSYELMKPVFLKDIVKMSNPPTINIKPEVSSSNAKSEIDYNLEIKQGNNILRKVSNNQIGNDGYTWDILEEPQPLFEEPIEITLNAKDQYGNGATDVKTTQVQQLTIKKKRYELKDDNRIEKFALIVFDFDKATLSERHKKVLDDIKTRIDENSQITIEGYTDRIGTAEYNKQLALKRAEEVKKYINAAESKVNLKAIGQDELLYDNDLPQGRNYSRTVLVKIITPIK
jgi:outer membrane protein OmpA-like peptidoglycan-associated protein